MHRHFDSGFNLDFGAKRKGFLQLVVGDATGDTNYKDGDIKSAVNWRHCRCGVAQGICFAKAVVAGSRQVARLNSDGRYDDTDVAKDYMEATHQFRFERTGDLTGKIVRLSDLDEITFNSNETFVQHDGKAVQLDLKRTVARIIETLVSSGGRGKPLFGTPGLEVWYGGRKDESHAKLDVVWAAIEAKTAFVENDEVTGATFSSYRKVLTISVDDFDDAESAVLTLPLMDYTDPENSVLVKKRKNWVQWRNLRDVVESDVIDKQKVVRIDNIRKHVRSQIKLEKVLT